MLRHGWVVSKRLGAFLGRKLSSIGLLVSWSFGLFGLGLNLVSRFGTVAPQTGYEDGLPLVDDLVSATKSEMLTMLSCRSQFKFNFFFVAFFCLGYCSVCLLICLCYADSCFFLFFVFVFLFMV